MSSEESDPAHDRAKPYFDRAFDIWMLEGGRIEDAIDSGSPLSDHDALAKAFDFAVSRAVHYANVLDEHNTMARRVPEHNRCGWCVRVAGDDEAAWQSAPSMTNAEIKAHTLVCPHNPLVQELERLRPVYAAAKAWGEVRNGLGDRVAWNLKKAVDAAIAKEPTP